MQKDSKQIHIKDSKTDTYKKTKKQIQTKNRSAGIDLMIINRRRGGF